MVETPWDSARRRRNLGAEIRVRRAKAGLTLTELAGAARLSKPELAEIERAERVIDTDQAERIAAVLGLSVAELADSAEATAAEMGRLRARVESETHLTPDLTPPVSGDGFGDIPR